MIRVCEKCGQKNRVPAKHLHHEGNCGACKAPLPPIAEPIDADGALFEEIRNDAQVPVLVDFWAAWCGPCRAAAPEVAGVARDLQGKAIVVKVDTEREPGLAQRYNVRGIPNFMVLKNGQPALQQAGLVGKETMKSWLR